MSKERVMVSKPSDLEALSVSLVTGRNCVIYKGSRLASLLWYVFSLLAKFQKPEGPCGN